MKWNMQKKEHTITGKKKKNTYGNENNISMAKAKLFQIKVALSTRTEG